MRTIAHISDLHFGRHDPDIVRVLASDLNQRKPDIVVVSGDVTQRARTDEFLEAQRFLRGLGPPKLVVPGNHDIPLYGLHRRIFSPFARFNLAMAPASIPGACFRDDQIAVFGINTARRFPGKSGRVSHEQIAEIRRVFCAMPSEIFKVLVTHHPIGSPDAPGVKLAGRSRMALRAIGDSGGHLLLSGHYHRATSGEIAAQVAADRSVLVVHAGTAVSDRLRGGEGNNYNLIRIDGHELTVTVMHYEHAAGFHETDRRTFLWKDGCWQSG